MSQAAQDALAFVALRLKEADAEAMKWRAAHDALLDALRNLVEVAEHNLPYDSEDVPGSESQKAAAAMATARAFIARYNPPSGATT